MKNMSKIAALILFLLWTSQAMAADVTKFHFGAAERQLYSSTDEVAAGYYDASTLHTVDTDLAAGNIKSGTMVFGITGTYQGTAGTSEYGLLATGQTTTNEPYLSDSVTDYPSTGSKEGCDGWYHKGRVHSYTDNGNGTITDNNTGLMWVKDGTGAGCDYSTMLTWEAAIAFCENLTFAGYTDWRLPNVNELQSIVDYSVSPPTIDPVFINTHGAYYWSSTPFTNPAYLAWIVDFDTGLSYFEAKTTNTYYVRPVRGGQ